MCFAMVLVCFLNKFILSLFGFLVVADWQCSLPLVSSFEQVKFTVSSILGSTRWGRKGLGFRWRLTDLTAGLPINWDPWSAPAPSYIDPMARPVGLKVKLKCLLQFMGPKLEPRRTKTPKKHPLKLFGNRRLDKLVGEILYSTQHFLFICNKPNF